MRILRRTALTVFVIGLAVSAHQAFGFSSARPEQEIPFELMRNKIIVPVRVNGSRELKIILDTGMPSQGLLIFDPQLTQELKLAGSARYLIDGAGQETLPQAQPLLQRAFCPALGAPVVLFS